MEPIRDNDDFKGAVRNVINSQKGNICKKGVFKEDCSLGALFFNVLAENKSVMDS